MKDILRNWGGGLAICLAAAGGPSASAAIIASDGFDAATHPTGSRSTVTPPVIPGNNGITFYTKFADPGGGTAAIVSDSAVGGTTPQALSVTTATGNSFPVIGILPAMGMVTNVNDAVTLSFRFRFLNAATATDNNSSFRFGLFNSNFTSVTSDNSSASDNDQGYYVQIGDAAQTTGNLFYRENGGTTPIIGGTDRSVLTASSAVGAITDAVGHTASLTLTRTSATTLGLSLVIDGGTPVTASSTTIFPGFDEIAFSDGFVGTAAAQLNFAVDDVVVQANNVFVPEPGAVGAMAVAGAAALMRRRKGRR